MKRLIRLWTLLVLALLVGWYWQGCTEPLAPAYGEATTAPRVSVERFGELTIYTDSLLDNVCYVNRGISCLPLGAWEETEDGDAQNWD